MPKTLSKNTSIFQIGDLVLVSGDKVGIIYEEFNNHHIYLIGYPLYPEECSLSLVKNLKLLTSQTDCSKIFPEERVLLLNWLKRHKLLLTSDIPQLREFAKKYKNLSFLKEKLKNVELSHHKKKSKR